MRTGLLARSVLAFGACDALDSRRSTALKPRLGPPRDGAGFGDGRTLGFEHSAHCARRSLRGHLELSAERPDLDNQPLVGAGEREGTYTVTVRKAGFIDWERTNVVVTADGCHVRPVAVTGRLERAP